MELLSLLILKIKIPKVIDMVPDIVDRFSGKFGKVKTDADIDEVIDEMSNNVE